MEKDLSLQSQLAFEERGKAVATERLAELVTDKVLGITSGAIGVISIFLP